jgi:hypothetical protein
MDTKKTIFTLYFHDVSKNFRVLVNGDVHPLLCGLNDIGEAEQATRNLFGDEFDGFDNIVNGRHYFNSGALCSKTEMIDALESAIKILKGASQAQLACLYLDLAIDFKPGAREDRYGTDKE